MHSPLCSVAGDVRRKDRWSLEDCLGSVCVGLCHEGEKEKRSPGLLCGASSCCDCWLKWSTYSRINMGGVGDSWAKHQPPGVKLGEVATCTFNEFLP